MSKSFRLKEDTILCACIIKNTNDVFEILEKIRSIEGVHKVTWSEEVSTISRDVTSVEDRVVEDLQ